MGLDLWFREDVARILASAHETVRASMGASAPTSPELADAYQRGFVDALRAVAVAFGVTPAHSPATGVIYAPPQAQAHQELPTWQITAT